MPAKYNMETGSALSRFGHRLTAGEFRKATSRVESRVPLAVLLALGCLLNFHAQIDFPAQIYAAVEVPRESQIKANWLLKFFYYVGWPPAALAGNESPLIIGILGPDPFRQALEKLLDQKIGGREVKLVRFDSVEKLGDCHILYVNLPDRRDVQQAVDLLREKPILTVSDRDEFTLQGGMISLRKYKNQLKPYINNAAARRAGLVIDASLLAVCEITDK